MTQAASPFAVPETLPQPLDDVRIYWEGLRRAGNEMPFWDDVNLSALPDQSDQLMLIDAFDSPQRFRLNTLGAKIHSRYGTNVTSRFIDEIEPKVPFELLAAQASATLELKRPTFLQLNSFGGYSRMLLPMWGNGRIEMLLGAITAERLLGFTAGEVQGT
jgi:hypothetical protein